MKKKNQNSLIKPDPCGIGCSINQSAPLPKPPLPIDLDSKFIHNWKQTLNLISLRKYIRLRHILSGRGPPVGLVLGDSYARLRLPKDVSFYTYM